MCMLLWLVFIMYVNGAVGMEVEPSYHYALSACKNSIKSKHGCINVY